jgi:hypothetical protein
LFEDGAGDFAKTTPERDSSALTRCLPQRRGCHTPCCVRQRCMTDATRWSWSKRNILIVTWSAAYCGAQCTIVERCSVERLARSRARASSALRRAVRCDPSGLVGARGSGREARRRASSRGSGRHSSAPGASEERRVGSSRADPEGVKRRGDLGAGAAR